MSKIAYSATLRVVLGFFLVFMAMFFSTAPLRAQVVSNDPNFTPSVLTSGLTSPDGVVFRASTGDLLVSQFGAGQISRVNATNGATNSFATQTAPDKVSVRVSDGLVAVISAPFGPIDFYSSDGTLLGSIDESVIASLGFITFGDGVDTVCLDGAVFDSSGHLFVAAGPGSTTGNGCVASSQWGVYEFAGPTPWTSAATLVTGFGDASVVIQDMAYSAARPPLGTLYAIDSQADDVYEISLTGACGELGICPVLITNVPAENPRGIAVDPLLGDIYVTDFDGADVYRIPAGGHCGECNPTTIFATGFTSSLRLDFDTTGNLYVNGSATIGDTTTTGTWKFSRASNATGLQAVTQGQPNFLNFVNPNPTMTDQSQNIMIPASANLGKTAFIQDIFVSVDPATLDSTLLFGTPGDVPFFGGAPVPPGTSCVPILSAGNNCVVVIQKCYDASHNPFAICPVQEPSSTSDLIQLTFSYAAPLAPQNGAFLIGFDDGDGKDITDITSFFTTDCCTGGGSGKSLCSKTFAASLGTDTSADFSVSVSDPNPAILDLTANNPATATITVTPINGFASPVTLGVSDALAGLSATFTPSSVTPAGPPIMSDLSVQLSGNTTIGGMTALVGNLLANGCMDNSGIANALTSKLSAAQADISAGQIKTAINVLTALSDQVKAQTGKHIATTCTTTFPMLITGTASPVLLPEVRSTVANVKFGPAALLVADIQTILTSLKASVSTEDPITGFVVNSSGVGVPGVTLTLLDSTSHTLGTATTDATGFYFFATTGTLTSSQSYTIQVTGFPAPFTTATPTSSPFTWSGKGLAFNFTLN